jgi:hypothetical protein
METRRVVLLVGSGVAAVVLVGGLLVGVLVSAGGDTSRQESVARRGARVMPFDLDATTHVFDATTSGGVQTVVADRPQDADQVALVRSHLRSERAHFSEGDFSDPAEIHGHEMPGLAVLEARSDALVVTYVDVPAGGRVTYRSDDPDVVAALHDWFAAQLADHGRHATGSAAGD